jgi:hypothetical protein
VKTHIKDVASFYVTVIKHALSGDDHESGWGKYYFAAGYEYPLKSIAKAYAVVLHEKGIIDTAEPLVVTAAKLPIMKLVFIHEIFIQLFTSLEQILQWQLARVSRAGNGAWLESHPVVDLCWTGKGCGTRTARMIYGHQTVRIRESKQITLHPYGRRETKHRGQYIVTSNQYNEASHEVNPYYYEWSCSAKVSKLSMAAEL